MRKKFLSLALALVMCLGLMTAPASAASATITEILSAEELAALVGNSSVAGVHFSDGIAWIGSSSAYSGYGAIDTTGKVIVPAGTYENVRDFSEGLAWAYRNEAWYLIDNTGKELTSLTGLPPKSDSDIAAPFSDGLSRVVSPLGDRKYGYVDRTGKLVIPYDYHPQAHDFHDGLAAVYDSANAYWGYIDKTGKLVIPYQFAEANDFSNGIAEVQLGNRRTIIDKTGKDLVPQEYVVEYGKVTSEGAVVMENSTRKYGFVNKSGKLVSGGYDSVDQFVDGMAKVRKDHKYGFINESGVLAVPCTLEEADAFCDGYAVGTVKNGDGTWTYNIIDKTGRVTGTYTATKPYNVGNGCFRISSNASGKNRLGFVNYQGKEIVSCKYREVKEFSGGVAAVMNFDGLWGFVDTTGAEIMSCQFKEMSYFEEPGLFLVNKSSASNGWILLKSSGWTAPTTSGTPTTTAPAKPAGITATPTSSTVLVNGAQQSFDAYNINGANYFKLRDLAYVLSGTEKQFQVGWDNASKTIALTSGQGYTAVGGEMASGGGKAQSAAVSAAKLLVDGKEVSLTAYTIGGANYFMLRDIATLFDFGVGWDNASKTITIDTSIGYTA